MCIIKEVKKLWQKLHGHRSKIVILMEEERDIEGVNITFVRKHHKSKAAKISFDVILLNPPFTFKKGVKMFTLKDTYKVLIPIVITDAAGNPAPVDGPVVWTNSNPEVVDLVIAEDSLSAVASAIGPLGSTQIIATADADLGDGVITLTSDPLDLEVVADVASAIKLVPGVPEPK
jgi:hypothetical protein